MNVQEGRLILLNTLNTVRQRPYLNNQNGLKKTDDGDANQRPDNGGQHQQQNRNHDDNVIVRGRASQHIAQQQMNGRYQPNNRAARNPYPAGYTPYQRPNYPAAQQPRMTPPPQRPMPGYVPVNNNVNQPAPQPQRRSNRVNIAQILRDFRNTIKAIATPPDLEEQVEEYLQLVEMHVKRPNPNVPIVQNNLRSAAQILDRYITETLKKESKVVQNWLEALFLQQINYSYDEGEINESFLVRFPQNQPKPQPKQQPQQQSGPAHEPIGTAGDENVPIGDYEPVGVAPEEEPDLFDTSESVEESIQKTFVRKPHITVIPQDTRLKSLFIEAKKHAYEDNPKAAMQIFKEAFYRAEEIKDYETQSRICLEVGKIYDDNDYYVQALNSYRNSLNFTTDNEVRTQAHLSMAKIYDDVNQVEPAIDHYLVSVSYAGETDDVVTQSTTLAKIGNLLTDKYDKQCFEFYEEAKEVIASTDDAKTKGFVSSSTADAYSHFNFADTALKYYADAVNNYTKAGDYEELAQNYKSAAKLMMEFKNKSKSASLLKKALTYAYKAENEELINEITVMFAALGE